MYLNLCPQAVGIRADRFETLLELAVAHGFEGIDFPAGLIRSVEEAREAGLKMKEAGLQWGLFYLPTDFLQVDDDAFKTGLERLREMLPIVHAAGCTRTYNHVWPGSNEREFDENVEWHVDRLKKLMDLLSAYDVRLGIEFIGPKTLRDTFKHPFVSSLPQAVKLADAVSPDLGIVLDMFHWYTSGGDIEQLNLVPGSRIVNVHANDGTAGRTREEQQDLERAMPLSTGLIDAVAVVNKLREIEYDGPIICEPFQPTAGRFASMQQKDVAKEVSHCMKALLGSR